MITHRATYYELSPRSASLAIVDPGLYTAADPSCPSLTAPQLKPSNIPDGYMEQRMCQITPKPSKHETLHTG